MIEALLSLEEKGKEFPLLEHSYEPEILLLDEATSSLDIKNETELLNELEIIFKIKQLLYIHINILFKSR